MGARGGEVGERPDNYGRGQLRRSVDEPGRILHRLAEPHAAIWFAFGRTYHFRSTKFLQNSPMELVVYMSTLI